MALDPDFDYEREEITFGKQKPQTLRLRGIALEDLSIILANRLTEVEAMYALFAAAKASVFSRSALDGFVLTLIQKAPDLASEVISRCNDDPANMQLYRKIPLGVQAASLIAITKLTFEEAGGLKNLIAMLASLGNEALPQDARERIASLLAPTEGSPTVQ